MGDRDEPYQRTGVILLGTIDCHFEENMRIVVANFEAGRPWDEGMIPHTVNDAGTLIIENLPEYLEIWNGRT